MKFKEYIESAKLFEELMLLAERDDRDYALDILDKINKVAAYLLKSKLDNPNDLARFEKFLDMVKAEMPKLDKSIDAVKDDIKTNKPKSNANTIEQTPRRYNYN